MAEYRAPTRDMLFVLNEVLDDQRIRDLPGYDDYEPETVSAVLDEAARFASDVLSPLNRPGDSEGVHWSEDGIVAAQGFGAAYGQYVEGGWNGLTGSADHGGMGMPRVLGAAAMEMWNAANMSFALCPLLTASAVEALENHGSDELKQTYLDKLVTGEWTGCMDLTEPQAGSDLAQVRSKAEPDGDAYRLFGQKIYITWGEHDMADNIIHFVLARLPDAPAGVKGISLFLVPKYILDDNGNPGERNDMRCASVEHKLGIHACPTCTMTYGEDGQGALGYLVGEENKGLAHMFTMMNAARHAMGVQGLGIADRAYQRALAYARDRQQGGRAIVEHGDVKRMLLSMRAQTDVLRAMCLDSASALDIAERSDNEDERAAAQARADVMIPVVKAWGTELGVDIANTGIQVHGGMGFVEETGAAQYLRDARIAPIYEGTNGIQAIDLVGRKLIRDEGRGMRALIADIRATADGSAEGANEHPALSDALDLLETATNTLLEAGRDAAMANAFNYLMLCGTVFGGWYAARIADVAKKALDSGTDEPDFYEARQACARFYVRQILPKARGYAAMVEGGPDVIDCVDAERHL
ncbi:acyl-CoA dehydrogenase [Salinisphaera shabanensis T35B1]|jgi:acyl-CoA dehydrogenase|uniref:3-methylmercaptopropionyl-CoA dehydrogenase n=1 Tax=Salinisphaera shabanensis E1L3A TaxID=1033802 RepID=U2EAR8_9GAMM|nr:acyl-CoA dehydrogenase [Salinisphaera shabanensis]ERJ20751.1 isoquinoline 1-oxidoreductase protein [Salinisphaera shabanensis E1L3A]